LYPVGITRVSFLWCKAAWAWNWSLASS
jgi:hypothetical protein